MNLTKSRLSFLSFSFFILILSMCGISPTSCGLPQDVSVVVFLANDFDYPETFDIKRYLERWGCSVTIAGLEENLIADNGYERIPQLEPFMLKTPEWTYKYALNITEGRWLEGEETIKTSPKYIYYYTYFVVESRWPEGEEIIKTNSYWRKEYNIEFICDI